MSHETWVLRRGVWYLKQDAPPLNRADAAPMVIGDTLPGGALRHPSNGQMYDSKSRFRDETRARGCVEVGNDVRPDRKPVDMPSPREDIRRAISELGGGS